MNSLYPLSVDSLLDELTAHPVNSNEFFVDFRDRFSHVRANEQVYLPIPLLLLSIRQSLRRAPLSYTP